MGHTDGYNLNFPHSQQDSSGTSNGFFRPGSIVLSLDMPVSVPSVSLR